jgi:hypothetical protein
VSALNAEASPGAKNFFEAKAEIEGEEEPPTIQ